MTLAQEEMRLKNQGNHSVNYINHQGNQGAKIFFMKKHDKGKRSLKINDESLQIQKKVSKGNNCQFYGKSGHLDKNCLKHKSWFEKKGELNTHVFFESNLTEVPHNTWWIDSGCMICVSNTMQGFLIIQTISPNEKFAFMGNKVKATVEAVRSYRLKLDIGHHLDLLETLYVPSLSRNFVSLSKLDVTGYSFNFGNECFSLFKHNHLIGASVLCDGLYKLKLDCLYAKTILTLHRNVDTKHSLVNERSTFLWHKS